MSDTAGCQLGTVNPHCQALTDRSLYSYEYIETHR
jgi:hypothetical protein